MADPDPLILELIIYECRQKKFGRVGKIANDGLERFVNHPVFVLYSGISHLFQGEIQKGLRVMEPMLSHPDVSLAAIYATVHGHKSSETVDREAVSLLEDTGRDERRRAKASAQYYAAHFFTYIQSWDRAKELSDKALSMEPSNAKYLSLKGWIELQSGRDPKLAYKYFDESINSEDEKGDLSGWMGLIQYYFLRQNQQGMKEAIDQAMKISPNFLPLNIERMKLDLLAGNWEKMFETAERCLVIDDNCLEAHVYLILHSVAYEGKYADGSSAIGELNQMLQTVEPNNVQLCLKLVQLFTRISGGKDEIIQQCKAMLDRTAQFKKTPDILCEQGKIQSLMGNYKQGLRLFKEAMDMQTSSEAIIGLSYCHIMDGNLKDAEAQVEFFKVANQSQFTNSVELSSLEVLMALNKKKPRNEILHAFKSMMNAHFSRAQSKPMGMDYLIELNATFVIEMADNLFQLAPNDSSKKEDPALMEIERVLSVTIEAMPGLSHALYMRAKAKYYSGQLDQAIHNLKICLGKDQTYSPPHLLLAQIYVEKKNLREAGKSLEVGLSYNFQVRDHPIYYLIKSLISKHSHDPEGALKQLYAAMELPKFKDAGKASADKDRSLPMTTADKISIYLELIDSLQQLERTEEANKMMETALKEFKDGKEEERLLLCSADLAVSRGDVDHALSILKGVQPTQSNYLPAVQKMAEIYRHHKKDKRAFAMCYKDLVAKNPSPEAFILLGDAYMSIQEPERAIEVYEAAMKKNPRNHELARKIGKAYVQAHLYSKAVNYYEAALKTGQQNLLRQDLADLLFRLKNYEKCEKILKAGLENKNQTGHDIVSLLEEVKFLELLSKNYFERGSWEEAMKTLKQAKDEQARLLTNPSPHLPDIQAQKQLAANLCCQLGEFYENQRDLEKAIQHYNEALTYVENDSKVSLSLAHLHLMTNDFEESNRLCQKLLRLEPGNDQATLMMADLMYQRNQTDSAMFHFQHLLDRNPNQYHALARVVELTWRTGDGEQSERYLKAAMDKSPRAILDSGFNYCKGLYHWYTGDPNSALQHFNRARRDLEWGERAIYNMIEICLNPDNEIIGGEVFDDGDAGRDHDGDHTDTADKEDVREMGVRTAERFLKELRFKPGLDFKYRLMENFILLATKNRSNIELALENLNALAVGENPEEINSVGAVLGMARGFMMLKQTQKAKGQLKGVLAYPWNMEEADYLEQCWLLLADTYINQGKYDVASEILNTALRHNQSCIKAYEYMGFIREKEQKWWDAATNYEQAWKLSKRRNPTIGYKLGYNYLKSKRFVNAIDTCQRVLELYPHYPKIRRDILDKARANLRTF